VFAFAAIVALAGCAGPRAAAPEGAKIQSPPAWRTSADAAGELSATWWQSFDDPGLTAVIETALAHNEDIQIATVRIEQLAGQVAIAHTQQLPNVAGRALYQRDRSINPASGIPELENVSEAGVAFSYDADLFGRMRAASASARANLLATRAAQADVKLTVVALAARSWFTLRSLDETLDTLRETLATVEQTRALVLRRVSVGYAAQLDLTQIEAEYQATKQQIPATELAIARTEDALSALLGESPRAMERSTVASRLPAIPTVLPSSLLRRRPDIVEAEQRLVAADHGLDASRAAFMPDLQLRAGWTSVNSTILPSNPVDAFVIGASVLAPIFDAGRLKARESVAVARRDEAAWAYRKTAMKAFSEVDDALVSIQRLREQLAALEEQHAALGRALGIASQRYRTGYSPFLDQLDAQRHLLSVQLAISRLRADQRNAFVTLFQSLGGGWDANALKAADQSRVFTLPATEGCHSTVDLKCDTLRFEAGMPRSDHGKGSLACGPSWLAEQTPEAGQHA
jgi:NodT family efflux transporter outer membrane factor (OMF) lipoprotein